MKSKTKKTLIISIIALMLCVAMVLGATYAWFTDSVTSGTNKIVAGNLDIEVQYALQSAVEGGIADDEWKDLESAGDLFKEDQLWEPGATRIVYLKIENKGTLDCYCSARVTPVSEKGGVNKDGESFKLSDYLVFAVTGPTETVNTYATRTAAREDIATGTAMGLNANVLSNNYTIKNKDTYYFAFIVYMPEEVGNKANYKTGTQAPEIELGIEVYATQINSEEDSFGDDYDADAYKDYSTNYAPSYSYFPQVVKTATKAATGTTTITEVDKDDNVLVEVKVPADAVAADTDELTVTVTPKEATDATKKALSVELNDDNRTLTNYDVIIDGIRNDNTANIEIKLNVGTGLSNAKVYHNGTEITDAKYDSKTGYVTFTTTSCSDYSVAYDSEAFMNAAVAKVGSNCYATLAEAVTAVKNGETVTVRKDCSDAGLFVGSDDAKDFTIDFGGYTFNCTSPVGSTGTESQAIHLEGGKNVTLKNGTVTSTAGKNVKMLVQNYCNLTLEDITLDGSKLDESNIDYYTLSNNGDITTTIKEGTTIIAHADNGSKTGMAFDADKGSTVNVVGGVIKGLIEETDKSTDEITYNSTIVITGGTFTTDPSAYVASGYAVTKDADAGTWTVAECTEHEPNSDGVCTKCGKQCVVVEAGSDAAVTKANITNAISNAEENAYIVLPSVSQVIDLSNTTISSTKNVTIQGTKGITLKVSTNGAAPSVNADGITFKNVTFDFGNNDYNTYNSIIGNVTYDNCTFNGLVNSYDNSTFVDCTFNNTGDNYCFHVYAGTTTCTGCKFNGDVKCAYVYTDGYDATANFTNCSFNFSTQTPDKSAIMLNACNGDGAYTVTITNCTQTGANTTAAENAAGNTNYQGIYGLKHKNGNGAAQLVMGTVTVDGNVVYSCLEQE